MAKRLQHKRKGSVSVSPKNRMDIVWDDVLPGFGLRTYASGKKSYVLKYRFKGKQHIVTIGSASLLNKPEAKALAKRHLLGIIYDIDPFPEKSRKRIKLATFCTKYLESWAKIHKRSWDKDARRIKQYILPRWPNAYLHDVSHKQIADFHAELGRTYPYEANRLREQLSKMFEVARDWGYIDHLQQNPAKGIKDFPEHKRRRYVTDLELPSLAYSIAQEPSVVVRNVIWLYLLTGLRKRELLSLRWEDVDFGQRVIHIRQTKSGKPLDQPLSAGAMALLRAMPRKPDNPWVVIGKNEGAHRIDINIAWGRIRKRAGLPDLRIHDLRRTLACSLLNSGATLELVGEILNHSTLSVSADYAYFVNDTVRLALEQHSARLRSWGNW